MEHTVEWIAYAETIEGNRGLAEWMEDHGQSTAHGCVVTGGTSKRGKPTTGYPFEGTLLSELLSLAGSDPRLKIRILRRRSPQEDWELCGWLFRPVKVAVATQVARALAGMEPKIPR
jgi:hypothetical protein